MSIEYDKIPVKWITKEERILEAAKRSLRLDQNHPQYDCDVCLARVDVHGEHYLIRNEQHFDEAKKYVEDTIRRMVLRKVYEPIVERHDRLMEMKVAILRNIDRTIHYEAVHTILAPLDEVMSIVYPPRKF